MCTTDRTFHRNDRSTGSRFPRFPQNRNPRYQPRFRNSQRPQPKRCFVCKKEGCWSTNQYITEYEGTKEDAGFDAFEAFIMEFEGDIEHAEQFMVSTVNTLTNHSL